MPQFKLVLYPSGPVSGQIDTERLLAELQACGLCGRPHADKRWLAGAKFVELLTFLGCSPHISLSPEEGDTFCHIHITAQQSQRMCVGHTPSAVPACPHCKHRIRDWKNISDWQRGEADCLCPQCGMHTRMQNLKWKQECGYGSLSVEIFNIHPFEAVPTEELLLALQQASGLDWDYCYAAGE